MTESSQGKPDPDDPIAARDFAYDLASKEFSHGGPDVDGCVTVASNINRRLEAAVDLLKREGMPIACKAGCSWCCHLRVELLPYEAIAIFRYIRTAMPKSLADHVSERINAKAEQIRPMTPREHECAKVQCAFLVDGRCSVYPVRPMACAAHHSADVAVCEAAFHRPTGQDDLIPQVANLVRSREAMQAAANQAMVNRNLRRQCIELHTAISALLRDPSLIGKWRSGRPLIKDATHVREES